MAFALQVQQGRLLITLISQPVVPNEGAAYVEMMTRALEPLKGQAIMLTNVNVNQGAPKPMIAAYADVLRSFNGRMLRSAIYVGHNATIGLQIYNMAKSADNPSRRIFLQVPEIREWLGEVCDAPEKAALDAYLERMKVSG